MPPEPTTTRADFAARVIAVMREQGLQGEITHNEIAGTLVHAERGPFDLEAAFRHFTGPSVRPDNDETPCVRYSGTISWTDLNQADHRGPVEQRKEMHESP